MLRVRAVPRKRRNVQRDSHIYLREKPRCPDADEFKKNSTFPVIDVLQYPYRHQRSSFSQTRNPMALLVALSWAEPTKANSRSPLGGLLAEEGHTKQYFSAYAMS
jgi:hypothetical protein